MTEDIVDAELKAFIENSSEEDIVNLVNDFPPDMIDAFLKSTSTARAQHHFKSPLYLARNIDRNYKARNHLVYLTRRLRQAVIDVENGQSRKLVISMPPRLGKSQLTSIYLPLWLLARDPTWKIGMISNESSLAVSFGRAVRRIVDNHPELGIKIAKDAGAASEWETPEGGGILSRSVGSSVVGRGFSCLIMDDVVKDFASAHSSLVRNSIWNWWLSDAQTRLEPPSLVIAIGTRWHMDDYLGRIASHENEGDPGEWEVISLPAIAETDDILGRKPGDPLISPLIDETPEEAIERWSQIKNSVGTYAFSALYQQHPSPSQGAIFEVDWWRYWTTDESKATDDGRVVYLNPTAPEYSRARWLDSWDCAFKATDQSDFVVGQRWMRHGPNRYLIQQQRGRWTFTQTLERMRHWADYTQDIPGQLSTHERLIEDKANGTAAIDVLKEEIAGLIPVNPTNSKEGRMRAVTPECESGNVILPLPSDPGNEWVQDLLSELRDAPNASHDDMTDSLSQALMRLRDPRKGSITVPGRTARTIGTRATTGRR